MELELIWVFNLYKAARARVNVTVTIHPPSEKWSSTSFSFGAYRVANFTASEYATGKRLPVNVSQQTSLGTTATVKFTSIQGDGYRFSLLFDSVEGFGKLGDVFTLTWTWGATFPEPQHVTVIFPLGFDCARPLQLGCVNFPASPANYTRTTAGSRVAVSFMATSLANDSLTWLVAYQQPNNSTNATSTSISITAASTSTAQPNHNLGSTRGVRNVVLGRPEQNKEVPRYAEAIRVTYIQFILGESREARDDVSCSSVVARSQL